MPKRLKFGRGSTDRFKSRYHDMVVTAIKENPSNLNHDVLNRGEKLYCERDFQFEYASGTLGSIDLFYIVFLENVYHLVGIEYESSSYGEDHAIYQLKMAKKRVIDQYRDIIKRKLGDVNSCNSVEWHGLMVYCAEDLETVVYLQEILDAIEVEEISHRYLAR